MENTALVLIDFQNDYFSSFEGAKWELNKTEEAASNALKILNMFREKNMNVIHVRHEFPIDAAPFFEPDSLGAKIHHTLMPKEGEFEVLKNEINAFKGTNLKQILDELKVKNILIVGAMSHICIDAMTRASSDYGYNCYLAHDACATLDVEFDGITVPAKMVHASYMSALNFGYATVESTESLLELL